MALKTPKAIRAGRASNAALAALCHRMATSLDAGIDVLRVWRGEADRARGGTKGVYGDVLERIVRGEGLAESIRARSDYFPRLFVEMTDVGRRPEQHPKSTDASRNTTIIRSASAGISSHESPGRRYSLRSRSASSRC